MLARLTASGAFGLVIWLSFGARAVFGGTQSRAMPTASLPIEPASDDHDILGDKGRDPVPLDAKTLAPTRVRPVRSSEARNLGADVAILMTREGFGAQVQVLQYAQPWLAVSQSLRYQGQGKEVEAFYESRYGMMLGLELHPWRSARFSPLLNLQAGADRFLRSSDQPQLNLFGFEAAAGVELRLARAASFLFQWTETYYPDLQEQLFVDQRPQDKYAGSFQVFFNLRWESAM